MIARQHRHRNAGFGEQRDRCRRIGPQSVGKNDPADQRCIFRHADERVRFRAHLDERGIVDGHARFGKKRG